MAVDHLSNALNSIKVHEMVGKRECKIPASKMIENIMNIFVKYGYVKSYEKMKAENSEYLVVKLDGRINNCGTIKPRTPVKKGEWPKTEQKVIPAIGIGLLIVSTPKGIITNREAQKSRIGGRLIAYVY